MLAVGAFDDRGEEAACKADFKAVEVAVEAYRAKNQEYPASLEALVPEYLRELPSSEKCTITLAADGTVTATGAYNSSSGGGASPGASESSAPGGTAPSTPTGLSVQNNCPGTSNNRNCTASWNASTGSPTPTYEWEVDNNSTGGGSGGANCVEGDFTGSRVATGTAATTNITLQNMPNDNNLCFRVRAVNSAGESGWAYAQFTP